MNNQYYQEFRDYEERALKKQASASLRMFIESFETRVEKEEWVWENLPSLAKNRHSRIRHEIFHELVYPILKAGYMNNDFSSTIWLGKLAQSIYQAKEVHEELGWVTELRLYEKAHEIDPNNTEARLLLLKAMVAWLEYSEHEWPSGILHGNDGASLEQCEEIEVEVQRVLELDRENIYGEFIKQYLKKLSEYRARLNKAV